MSGSCPWHEWRCPYSPHEVRSVFSYMLRMCPPIPNLLVFFLLKSGMKFFFNQMPFQSLWRRSWFCPLDLFIWGVIGWHIVIVLISNKEPYSYILNELDLRHIRDADSDHERIAYRGSNILSSLLQLLRTDSLVPWYDPVFSRWSLQVQNEGVSRWARVWCLHQLHDGESDSPTWETREWQVSERPWAFPRSRWWSVRIALGREATGKRIQYGRWMISKVLGVPQKYNEA